MLELAPNVALATMLPGGNSFTLSKTTRRDHRPIAATSMSEIGTIDLPEALMVELGVLSCTRKRAVITARAARLMSAIGAKRKTYAHAADFRFEMRCLPLDPHPTRFPDPPFPDPSAAVVL